MSTRRPSCRRIPMRILKPFRRPSRAGANVSAWLWLQSDVDGFSAVGLGRAASIAAGVGGWGNGSEAAEGMQCVAIDSRSFPFLRNTTESCVAKSGIMGGQVIACEGYVLSIKRSRDGSVCWNARDTRVRVRHSTSHGSSSFAAFLCGAASLRNGAWSGCRVGTRAVANNRLSRSRRQRDALVQRLGGCRTSIGSRMRGKTTSRSRLSLTVEVRSTEGDQR